MGSQARQRVLGRAVPEAKGQIEIIRLLAKQQVPDLRTLSASLDFLEGALIWRP